MDLYTGVHDLPKFQCISLDTTGAKCEQLCKRYVIEIVSYIGVINILSNVTQELPTNVHFILPLGKGIHGALNRPVYAKQQPGFRKMKSSGHLIFVTTSNRNTKQLRYVEKA